MSGLEDPGCVRYEWDVSYGNVKGRADYALFASGSRRQPDVIIKAKRPGHLRSAAGDQAIEYARKAGGRTLHMVVATDGRTWRFYDALADGPDADAWLAMELDLAAMSLHEACGTLSAPLGQDAVAQAKHTILLEAAHSKRQGNRAWERAQRSLGAGDPQQAEPPKDADAQTPAPPRKRSKVPVYLRLRDFEQITQGRSAALFALFRCLVQEWAKPCCKPSKTHSKTSTS